MLSLNSRRVVLLILLLFFLPWRNALPGAAQQPSTRYGVIDDARLAQSQKEPQNWPIYNGGWYEHRDSFLDQINADNVSRLKPAWFVEFDTTRGQKSTPLVVDGVMYVSTAWSKVYALDARTGKEIWRYDPKVPRCCRQQCHSGSKAFRIHRSTGRLATHRQRWGVGKSWHDRLVQISEPPAGRQDSSVRCRASQDTATVRNPRY